jgi:rhodanese-related sulfurtransferase/DNA-binding transcriptional ArsR family regulator
LLDYLILCSERIVPQTPSRTFKSAAYAHLAEVGKALSSPARLEMLELLAQAPRTVDVLAGEIDQSVANTSHHLQALKRAQLVTARRDGVHVIYSLAGADVAALLVQLQAVAAQHIAGLDKLTREFFAAPDGLEAVDRDTLLARLRANDVVLLDVRPEHEFQAGHLPGALSVPLETLEARLADLPRHRTIVAYCRGPFCTLSAEAAHRLRALGFDARRSDVSIHSLAVEGASP